MATTYSYNENDSVGVSGTEGVDLSILQTAIENDVGITTTLSYVGRSVNGSSFTIEPTFVSARKIYNSYQSAS